MWLCKLLLLNNDAFYSTNIHKKIIKYIVKKDKINSSYILLSEI